MAKFIEVFNPATGEKMAVNVDHISKIVSLNKGGLSGIVFDGNHLKNIIVKSNFDNLISEINEGE